MLTTTNSKEHNPFIIAKAMNGFGSLCVAVNDRKVPSNAVFLRLVTPVMGGLSGEPQGSLVPHQSSNPSSTTHPFGRGRLVNPTMRRIKMSNNSTKKIRQTKEYAFFSCSVNKESLFTIRAGLDLEDALSQASCFLASALKITEDLAFEGDSTQAQAWAAYYLIEISKAVVDSALSSYEFGENHG